MALALACGSEDTSGSGGSSGGGGSGGSPGTTCADGYPTLQTPCAIPFEKCTSCGSWACCDIFECQQGFWAQPQSHLACPNDAGSDVADAASDAVLDGSPDDASADADATD